MDHIWRTCSDCEFSVRQIMEGVNQNAKKPYAYNTILTVITHLYEKKLLTRKKSGKTCYYQTRMTKDEYAGAASKHAFDQLRSEFGPLAIAHFANLLDDVDPELLKKAKEQLDQ